MPSSNVLFAYSFQGDAIAAHGGSLSGHVFVVGVF